ncbi:unnamed protein product [Bursaphelenchus xylophilus]|uniref:(pine wood nematode) hypothetical protein n=1 Tax=Bursaphelenchus xylophilus TaxID=6326 RepID=A0A1I7RH85_BURXY|nr:unnamed protein product [Bursaphelenchus xylophilus]CAG9115936.1 unnamed protein product [Bursaphelenchus xylophilus]
MGSVGICLWQRRNECRKENEKRPPIELEQFLNEYVKTGKVSAMVIHPHFEVIDVFLTKDKADDFQAQAKKFLSTFSSGPERYAKDPDLRVSFKCDEKQLETAISEAQQAFSGTSEIKVELNSFPGPKEIGFIVLSSVIAIVLVGSFNL